MNGAQFERDFFFFKQHSNFASMQIHFKMLSSGCQVYYSF